MYSLEIHLSFSPSLLMLSPTILVVISEHAERQNQYLIKLFQFGELQLLQIMSMKYGFINRIPGSVYTKTKQLGNLVNSVLKKKKVN